MGRQVVGGAAGGGNGSEEHGGVGGRTSGEGSSEEAGRAEERARRLVRLVALQQQQLSALRLRLGRRERQVLALTGKDGGKALTVAQHEAHAAHARLRLSEGEAAELRRSMLELELISRGGELRQQNGVGGELPPDFSGDLHKFVTGRARETAALREQARW